MAMFTLTQCMPYFQIFGTAQGAAAKIFDVIDHQPQINLSKGKGVKIENCKGRIRFEDVHFSYPARRDVPVSLVKTDLGLMELTQFISRF